MVVTTGAIRWAKLQSNVAINKPTSNFLQAGCPSCHPTNNVKHTKSKLRKSMTKVNRKTKLEMERVEFFLNGPRSIFDIPSKGPDTQAVDSTCTNAPDVISCRDLASSDLGKPLFQCCQASLKHFYLLSFS